MNFSNLVFNILIAALVILVSDIAYLNWILFTIHVVMSVVVVWALFNFELFDSKVALAKKIRPRATQKFLNERAITEAFFNLVIHSIELVFILSLR
jgi:hypothetical protein